MSFSNTRLHGRQGLLGVRKWSAIGLLVGIVTAGLMTAMAGRIELAETPSQGLGEVLPAAVPDDLNAEAFAVLDGNWAEWSTKTAADVAGLYEAEGRDAAGDQKIIDTLRSRLRVMDRALSDDRYRAIHEPLANLYSRLLRRVDLAEAALDTMNMDPVEAKRKRLDATRREAIQAVNDVSSYLRSIDKGTLWMTYLRVANVDQAVSDVNASDSEIALVESVHRKLQARDSLADQRQREFLDRDQFVALERALGDYLDAVKASHRPAANPSEISADLKMLLASLESYSKDRTSSAAAESRDAYRKLQTIAPDGGDRVGLALRSHYFNYNLKVAASEGFVNRIFSEHREETGDVVDYILGANVYGTQETSTTVGADLVPSARNVRFRVTIDGVTESDTRGYRSNATIYTHGYHTFYATKDVSFDGARFVTRPARISVNANNTTTGATTKYSSGLFGGIADDIAMSSARRKRGQSEAIAASRVRDRVNPRFNEEADERFERANEKFDEKVVRPLKDLDLYPDAMSYQTTDDEARISTRLMAKSELGGETPQLISPPADSATLFVHESLLNNSLDRMDFAGKTLNEDEVRAKLDDFFIKLLGRKLKLPGTEIKDEEADEQGPKVFVFDQIDPIRVHIDDNSLALVLRTGFQQENKEDIPIKEITVPLTVSMDEDTLTVERGRVRVASIERPASVAQGIAHAGVIRKKIQSAITPRKIDRKFSVEQEKGYPDIPLEVTDVKMSDGWLAVTVQ